MDIKKFTTELVAEWRKRDKGLSGMAGVVENRELGIKGEKYAISKLKNNHKDYQFCLTNYSWTPADIIGFKKSSKFWHFALFQVKTSTDTKSLTSDIIEKQTLPILAKVLKQLFESSSETNYYKNKEVFITLGYIGVVNQNGRNKLFKLQPYEKEYTINKLSLSRTEKTKLKNLIHR